MDDMGATGQAETVIHASPEAWLPIVEPPLLIDGNQHVMIQMARIGVLGRPIISEVIGLRRRHGPGPKKRSRGTVANASMTACEPNLAV